MSINIEVDLVQALAVLLPVMAIAVMLGVEYGEMATCRNLAVAALSVSPDTIAC